MYRFALCPLDAGSQVSLDSMESTWTKVCKQVSKAQSWGAQCVAFPELTLTGFDLKAASADCIQASEHSEKLGLQAWSDLARSQGIAICAGIALAPATFKNLGGQSVEINPNLPLNCAVFWDAKGSLLAVYAKVHGFSLGSEAEAFAQGSYVPTWEEDQISMAVQICYDLRFPELMRGLPQVGLWFNLACWPQRRQAHREILGAARALENRCFVAAVNRSGVDSLGLEYAGECLVWDPDGNLVPAIKQDADCAVFEIDPSRIRKARLALPALKDRRLDLWPHLGHS